MKKFYSILIAFSISSFIYVFYRSDKTVVNELVISIFSYDTYVSIKCSIVSAIPLNELIIFSLPGGLWLFCATLLAQRFYLKINRYKIQLFLIPVIFAIGLEFCQLIHLTNGRFDLWDIIFYAFFWLMAYLVKSSKSQQNIVSPFTFHSFICLVCILSVYLAHVTQ